MSDDYTPSLYEEEAFIATSFIDFHTQEPASGEWVPMTEDEARARWEAWLTQHDEAVRAEEREKAAQIAESSTRPLRWHGSMNEGSRSAWYARGVRDAAARIREQQP